jgi:uncharacterized protein DUF6869
MPGDEVEMLRRWARGDFYPLTPDEQGRDAVDELAAQMSAQPRSWWQAFQTLFREESDKAAFPNLSMPFSALLHVGGEPLWDEVAAVARQDRRIANAFWDAMDFLHHAQEAYKRLGRQMTLEAFLRHEPRIGPPGARQQWDEHWEDEWSGDVLFHLSEKDPEEAWAISLELLAVSDDPEWAATIGAFIVEDLLHHHGDVFIDRIEAESARNDRLQRALPVARWEVPEHLMARVRAAAGPYWDEKH